MYGSARLSLSAVDFAGCDKLTIGPKFLKQLSDSKDEVALKLNPEAAAKMEFEKVAIDEKKFRFMLNEDAMGTEKLAEGIRKFGVAAAALEEIIKAQLK